MAVTIAVYADWDGLSAPLRLGVLHCRRSAARELFEFEFDAAALALPAVTNLRLDISADDNAMDLDLARSVAPYFRVATSTANEVIERSQAVVRQWRKIAKRLGVPEREQERMGSAFRLAG